MIYHNYAVCSMKKKCEGQNIHILRVHKLTLQRVIHRGLFQLLKQTKKNISLHADTVYNQSKAWVKQVRGTLCKLY